MKDWFPLQSMCSFTTCFSSQHHEYEDGKDSQLSLPITLLLLQTHGVAVVHRFCLVVAGMVGASAAFS